MLQVLVRSDFVPLLVLKLETEVAQYPKEVWKHSLKLALELFLIHHAVCLFTKHVGVDMFS